MRYANCSTHRSHIRAHRSDIAPHTSWMTTRVHHSDVVYIDSLYCALGQDVGRITVKTKSSAHTLTRRRRRTSTCSKHCALTPSGHMHLCGARCLPRLCGSAIHHATDQPPSLASEPLPTYASLRAMYLQLCCVSHRQACTQRLIQ